MNLKDARWSAGELEAPVRLPSSAVLLEAVQTGARLLSRLLRQLTNLPPVVAINTGQRATFCAEPLNVQAACVCAAL